LFENSSTRLRIQEATNMVGLQKYCIVLYCTNGTLTTQPLLN
jgi:hypothetical protein